MEDPTANLFQVVVADEFEVNPEPIGKVKMGVTYLTEEQRLELDRRLAKFSDRVTHTLGVANFEENDINVKEGYPLRTRPYRIAPGMFDDLKGEIDDLISKGIIVPSRSPWSAPMVPLRKKSTGHVRLCIDYRRLNKITIPDPYQMPCIEDLLNQVSDAVWLLKLNLKGGTIPFNNEIFTHICSCHNFPPFFCADTFITSLLLIVCALR